MITNSESKPFFFSKRKGNKIIVYEQTISKI